MKFNQYFKFFIYMLVIILWLALFQFNTDVIKLIIEPKNVLDGIEGLIYLNLISNLLFY